jgi:HAD superfamily hydrolase (TIGR01484 family)
MKKIIFSDFDGTMTLENRELTPTFFEILDVMKKNKQELIIVSGRSLSWGHFFLTHFPQITAAIMEGGGVIVTRAKKADMVEDCLISEADLSHLEMVTESIREHFPRCPISMDSFGRKTDRAIEFEQMQDEDIKQVLDFFKTQKVNYSKSNVHINYWCGEISKYLGVKRYLEHHRKDINIDDCTFFGDAPNDESMFQLFPHSVGVSNIEHCLPKLKYKPKEILKGPEKSGPLGVLWYLRNS